MMSAGAQQPQWACAHLRNRAPEGVPVRISQNLGFRDKSFANSGPLFMLNSTLEIIERIMQWMELGRGSVCISIAVSPHPTLPHLLSEPQCPHWQSVRNWTICLNTQRWGFFWNTQAGCEPQSGLL